MAKVVLGTPSCQVFADLEPVPEVGDVITLRKEDVIETRGFGGGLIGEPLLITERADDLEIEGERVPHFGFKTV